MKDETTTLLQNDSPRPHPLRTQPFRKPPCRPASRLGRALVLPLALGLLLSGAAGAVPQPSAVSTPATSANPAEAAYLFALGKMLADEASYQEAQRVFERSLELDGSDPYVFLELARFHEDASQMARSAEIRRENLRQAAAYVERARQVAGDSVDVLRAYAQVYMRLGEQQLDALNRAQEAYEQLREKTEGDLRALTSLAQIYLWKRQPADAAEVLEEASAYLPGHRMIQTMLVEALIGSGETRKAEAALTRLLEIDPGNEENLVRLAELRSDLGDHAGAVAALTEAGDEIHRPGLRQLLARELHLSGQNDKALDVVNDLLRESPQAEGLRRLRIAILSAKARYREAAAELQDLLSGRQPDFQDGVLLARFLERVGRGDEAAAMIRRQLAVAEAENVLRLKMALSGVLRRQDRLDEAEKMLRAELATAVDTHEVVVLSVGLAEILEQAERRDEAVAVLDAALDHVGSGEGSAGERLTVELRRLAILAEAERWPEVEERAAPLLQAENAEARVTARQLLVDALAGQDRLDDALAQLEVAGASAEEERSLLAKRVALLFEHDEAAAEAVLRELQASGEAGDLFLAGRLYQAAERYDATVQTMDAFLEQEPGSVQGLFLRSAALERGGDRAAAVASFQHLLEIAPDHAPSLNYLGYLWAEGGEHLDEALALVQRAVAMEPDNGAYVDSLGWVLYRLGRYEEAREHLEWAARLLPDDATVFEHLGDLYLKLEQRQEARDSYRQAVDLRGDNVDEVKRKLESLDEVEELEELEGKGSL